MSDLMMAVGFTLEPVPHEVAMALGHHFQTFVDKGSHMSELTIMSLRAELGRQHSVIASLEADLKHAHMLIEELRDKCGP